MAFSPSPPSGQRPPTVVAFDSAKTTVEALTNATRNAGYPSTVAKAPK
jgi:hypothetical protein